MGNFGSLYRTWFGQELNSLYPKFAISGFVISRFYCIDRIFGDTFRMLRNIWMTFHYLNKDKMRKIITTMIRPTLYYAKVIWSPHKKAHVLKLEKIQKIATKMVPELEDLT